MNSAPARHPATTKLAHALSLAAQGFYVFPLASGRKTPLLKEDWKQLATRDPEKIRNLWSTYPAANIGIYTGKFGDGKALCVVDVDVKGEHNGFNTLVQLEIDGRELPPTLEADTPSGGRHLYYVVDAPVKQGAHVLGPGVDIRSRGGYVVGPGSETKEGAYTGRNPGMTPHSLSTEQWADINAGVDSLASPFEKQMPGWAKIRRAYLRDQTPAKDDTKPVTVDGTDAVLQALEYLTEAAPVAIKGAGGDNTTVAVANGVLDFLPSVAAAHRLMAHAWNDRCQPPWDPRDLRKKVESAAKSRQTRLGSKRAEADFEPIPDDGDDLFDTTPKAEVLRTLTVGDLMAMPPPEFLLEGWLPKTGVALLFGPSHSFKSVLAIDMALHIAAGKDWHGAKVDKRPVLYIAAEGAHGLAARVTGWIARHGGEDVPFRLVPCPVDLMKPAGAGAIIATVREHFGDLSPVVWVDTVIKSMPGGDENSAKDTAQFLRNLQSVADTLQGLIVGLHHTGKDSGRDERGSYNWRGSVDTSMKLERTGKLAAKLTNPKQKDAPEHDPIRLAMELHPIEMQGKPWTVPLIASIEAEVAGEPDDFFDLLQSIREAPVMSQRDRAERLGIPQAKVSRLTKEARTKGLIEDDGKGIGLTDAGRKRLQHIFPED